jgi:hypothetical protein
MASTGRLNPLLSRGGIFSKSLNKGGQFSRFTILYTTPAVGGGAKLYYSGGFASANRLARGLGWLTVLLLWLGL